MYKKLTKNMIVQLIIGLFFLVAIFILDFILIIVTKYNPFIILLVSLPLVSINMVIIVLKTSNSFKELNNWYEQILDFVYLPMSITDLDMNWTFINRSVKDIIGRTREDAIGLQCSNWNADICNTERCGICLLRKDEGTSYFVNEGIDKNYQVDTTYLYDLKKNKIGHLELVSDITAKVKLDESIYELKKYSEVNIKTKRAVQDPAENQLRNKNDINRHNMRQFTISKDTSSAKQLFETTKHEIIERKIAEEALGESQQQQRDLLNNTSSIIFIKDLEGRYQFVNRMFERAFNISDKEAYGKTDYEIMPEEIAKYYQDNDRNVLESDCLLEFEETAKLKDGEHTYISVKFPLKNSSGETYALSGISTDITKRIILEEQIFQSSKMDAIGQLAGGIAHDFNNMLGGIAAAGNVLLSKDRGLDKKGIKCVELILQSTIRAADLTSQLLTLGRKEKFTFEIIDIHNIIENTIEILKSTLDKKITISLIKNSKPHFIEANSSFLQSSLLNLGINASHAMPDGGEIIFGTKQVQLDKLYCESSIFKIKPGNYIEIEISDTGCGIKYENLKKIFDPFFTTKEQGKGTGLGLSTVYGTILGHHGSIFVRSEVGIGTTFTIQLPCSEKKAILIKNESIIVTGSGIILLVDDEEIIRITVKDMLEEMGYKVLLAKNGMECLTLFKQQYGNIDLVIMDMIMPDMSGSETYMKMKMIDENCKVIISSGYTKDENINDLRKMGLAGFIKKPFMDYEINKLIKKILKSK
ncbi:MAG: PAS domain-containing protein [Spirochaetaceae bacterium]